MKFEKHSVISLGNNKKYIISETLDYNNNKYLYLIELGDEDKLLDNVICVKIVKDHQGNYGIAEITDNKEMLEVQEIFFGMFT